MLQAVQDFTSSRHHRRREAGEPRHLDPVAAIRAPGNDLAQEDDVVLPLPRGDVGVDDPRERVGEVGQLVVMRCEQRLRPRLRVGREVLGHRPRDAQAVERRRAAADFIEHDEAARRRRVQDVGRLLHLHHERRLTAGDVVGRPDAREDAVDDRHLGVFRRDERADLREQGDERRLSQVGRLAAHVRPGQDHQLPRRSVQVDVVRDERLGREALDHGMAAVGHGVVVAVMDVRFGEVCDGRGFGQAGKDVEGGQGARSVLDARRFGADTRTQSFEDFQLALENPLVGAKDLPFVLLQRGRGEALAAGNRLLPLVIVGNGVQVRFRDLDVVAEHAVEPDLERADPGARALALLHLGNDLPAGAADRLQLVELGIDAVAGEAAIARERARLVDQRALDLGAELRKVVELGDQAAQERRLHLREQHRQAGNRCQRQPQRDQIARTGGAERGARHQTLEIVDRLQGVAKPCALGGPERELLDRVEPIADPLQRAQRAQQPPAQQAGAHRRDGAVDLVEQRSLRSAFAAGDDLEVLQRDRIDDEAVGNRLVADGADVREVCLLRVAQVTDQPAGCLHRRDPAVEAETFEPVGPELVEERAPRRFRLERPAVHGGDRNLEPRDLRKSSYSVWRVLVR